MKFAIFGGMLHYIHIPVMGICYTADSPMRIAHMGLTSAISLVDDGLLEEYRMAYAERLGVDVGTPQTSREERIRLYLDFVTNEVQRKFDWIRGLRVGGGNFHMNDGTVAGLNEKDRYFMMLPSGSPLRAEYDRVCSLSGLQRVSAEMDLTQKMECGEIQANIMVGLNHEDAAIAAVRGIAASKVRGSLIFSAGVNLAVFEEVAKHEEFFRQVVQPGGESVPPAKKIILKVSDYRSALIQGRYLAKKGLEVYEYRIESGVNCGGHAFFGARKSMPEVLREFVAKKRELFEATSAAIRSAGRVPPPSAARLTAQGGLCTAGEIEQVLAMGADGVGVGTPFLLVPQVTSLDAETRSLLAAATPDDVELSSASPLGIPFMNLKTSSAAVLTRQKAERYLMARGTPGYPCIQHYLCRSIPGFDHPVCMASVEYEKCRLAEIDRLETSGEFCAVEADAARKETLARECICRFLGNAGREEIRAKRPSIHFEPEKVAVARGVMPARHREPVTVCPGPNIAYFDREYTLLEMMQHLYGTGPSLTPANKPSAFEVEKQILKSV